MLKKKNMLAEGSVRRFMRLANLEPLAEEFVKDIYEAEEDAPIEDPLPGDEGEAGELPGPEDELPAEDEEGLPDEEPLAGAEVGVDDIPLEAREELMMNIASAIGEVLNVETDVSKEGGEEEFPDEEPEGEPEGELPDEEPEEVMEGGFDAGDLGDLDFDDFDPEQMEEGYGDYDEDIYEQLESMLQESKYKTKKLRQALRNPTVLRKVRSNIKRKVNKSKDRTLKELRGNPRAIERIAESVISRIKDITK